MEGRSGIDSPNAWTYRLNEGDYRKGGKRMATCRIRPVMARKWQGHHNNLQQGLKDTGWDGGHRELHSLQLTPTHHLASMSRAQPSLAPFPPFPDPLSTWTLLSSELTLWTGQLISPQRLPALFLHSSILHFLYISSFFPKIRNRLSPVGERARKWERLRK